MRCTLYLQTSVCTVALGTFKWIELLQNHFSDLLGSTIQMGSEKQPTLNHYYHAEEVKRPCREANLIDTTFCITKLINWCCCMYISNKFGHSLSGPTINQYIKLHEYFFVTNKYMCQDGHDIMFFTNVCKLMTTTVDKKEVCIHAAKLYLIVIFLFSRVSVATQFPVWLDQGHLTLFTTRKLQTGNPASLGGKSAWIWHRNFVQSNVLVLLS